ncbi:MAG: hypothetical protein AAF429_08565 [Pseudomonadota bacterium]
MSQFDAKKIYDTNGNLDLFEIRREAAQIRAVALRDLFAGLFSNVRVMPTVISKEA